MRELQLVTEAQRNLWEEHSPEAIERKKAERLSRKLHPIVERIKQLTNETGVPENPNNTQSKLISPWKQIAVDIESGAPVLGRLVGSRSDATAVRSTGIAYVDIETKVGQIDYGPSQEERAIRRVACFTGNNDSGSAHMLNEWGTLDPVSPSNQEELLPVVQSLAEKLDEAFTG